MANKVIKIKRKTIKGKSKDGSAIKVNKKMRGRRKKIRGIKRK